MAVSTKQDIVVRTPGSESCGAQGTSSIPCAPTFRGPAPAESAPSATAGTPATNLHPALTARNRIQQRARFSHHKALANGVTEMGSASRLSLRILIFQQFVVAVQ